MWLLLERKASAAPQSHKAGGCVSSINGRQSQSGQEIGSLYTQQMLTFPGASVGCSVGIV